MTISIKPAEIVGANIGDRVFISEDYPYAWAGYGVINGIRDNDMLVVVLDNGEHHQIDVKYLTLALKEFVIGDTVSGDDYDLLPDGVVLGGLKRYAALQKTLGKWYAANGIGGTIDPDHAREHPRTIIFLPEDD